MRKKYHIKKGSKVSVYEGRDGVIILKPLADDPLEAEATHGILKGKPSLLDALLKDRKEEAKRG